MISLLLSALLFICQMISLNLLNQILKLSKKYKERESTLGDHRSTSYTTLE